MTKKNNLSFVELFLRLKENKKCKTIGIETKIKL